MTDRPLQPGVLDVTETLLSVELAADLVVAPLTMTIQVSALEGDPSGVVGGVLV